MKDLWFEAYEEACNETDDEPTDAAVEALYQDRVEALYDRADDLRKAEREYGL